MPEAKTILCPDCRYSLKGLTRTENQVQCPECGRLWTNRELSSNIDRRRWWQRSRWHLVASLPIGLAVFAVTEYLGAPFAGVVLLFAWYWGCISWRLIAMTNDDRRRAEQTLFFPYLFDVATAFFLALFLLVFTAYPLSALYGLIRP